MSTNGPKPDEWLAEARSALNEDMSQWGGEYGLDLIAEVKRLRALITVDDAMVKRAVEAHRETFNAWPVKRNLEDAESRRVAAMRAALDAALNPGETPHEVPGETSVIAHSVGYGERRQGQSNERNR